MSLQYTLTAPNMVVECQDLHRSSDTMRNNWLQQLTTTAVEKALQHQLDCRSLAYTEEKASGRHSEVGCSKPISPLASFSPKSSTSFEHSRSWTLERESEDRRHVAAKIYALLVQWKSDFSFEWRAQVAAAVHTFEEALYQQAKSKEEYTDPLLLESQLRQVLHHFEAGNGPHLLQGSVTYYPLQPCHPPISDFYSAKSSIYLTDTPKSPQVFCQELMIPERSQVTALDGELPNLPRMNMVSHVTIGSLLASEFRSSQKEAANSALWEAVLTGQTRTLEEGLHKHGKFASKRLVKKVINMIFKKKREERRRLKHELRKAMAEHNAANLAIVLAKAKSKYGSELKDLCNTAEEVLGKWLVEEPTGGQALGHPLEQRKRKGRTLRDMLTLGCGDPDTSIFTDNVAMGMQPAQSARCPLALESHRSEETFSRINSDSHIDCESNLINRTELVGLEGVPCMPELHAMSIIKSTSTDAVGYDIQMESEGSSALTCKEHGLESIVLGDCTAELMKSNAEIQQEQVAHEVVKPQDEMEEMTAESSIEITNSGIGSSQSDDQGQQQTNNLQALEKTMDEQQQNTIYGADLGTDTDGNRAEQAQTHDLQGLETTSIEQHQSTINGVDLGTNTDENRTEQAHSPGTEAPEIAATVVRGNTSRVSLMRLLREGDGGSYLVNQHRMSSPLPSQDSTPWDTWEEPTEELDPMCCVCMVGLKGAAFIPCGHTFCRKCSRELWRGRGMCPLCNRYIREILDIY